MSSQYGPESHISINNICHIYTIILLKSVCRCSQTAGRNYCSIVSGDVSNCSYRLTVHPLVSVRPSIFFMRKTLKTLGKPGRQCLFQWPATSYCHQRSGPSRLAGTDTSNSDTVTCVHVRVGACARVCVHTCVMRLQYSIILFDPG